MSTVWKQEAAGMNSNRYARYDFGTSLFLRSNRIDRFNWIYSWSCPMFRMEKEFKALNIQSAKGLAVRGLRKELERIIDEGHPKKQFAQSVLDRLMEKVGRS